MNDASLRAEDEYVHAGRLAPWTVGDLPLPPLFGWRQWAGLIGPGVLLAGTSIGSGEWLAGPGVTAQYGGTLLWVATLSIVAQVFCNLEFMRYTLYCGEPILVGGFRTWPGPVCWTLVYGALELGHIWPYNVANAAVPLAAAVLGHLPGTGNFHLWGLSLAEREVVRYLGYALFLLSFVPLIFGGTVYKMLERIMTIKLVLVLVFLTIICAFMVSGRTALEVASGFFRFGEVPLRAETIIAGRHFTLTRQQGPARYTVRGTLEEAGPLVTEFQVEEGDQRSAFGLGQSPPEAHRERREEMVAEAVEIARRGGFLVEKSVDGRMLTLRGGIDPRGEWHLESVSVTDPDGTPRRYARIEDVPREWIGRARELTANQGVERTQLVDYLRKQGRLPDLDWAIIATFASIAGTGGLTNVLYSNYARDKGWGMGARVGAIPSAVGGRTIKLSHVGQVFRLDAVNRARWRGWMRHIVRDQVVIWMACCFIGMALPCMISLEFIRNAPVSGERVAAMTAEGMDLRYPGHGLWPLMLLMGFLVLYPGQIMTGDTTPRRWCDVIWTASPRAQRLEEHRVKYVYYSIMMVSLVWGLVAMTYFNPLQILKISGVIQNVALGVSALHALYINRTLLPKEIRPNRFIQAGVVFCGVFFIGISAIVLLRL